MLLSAKNLYKQYVDKPILDHQDLSIEEGDRIGLIGVNGCGKSTLLKILGGKEDYDGEIITSKDLKIALLEQNPAFTKESVQEELEYRNSLSKHPAEAFRVKAIATRFELPYDQTKIDTLSGGMKRRLDLAAILLSDANLLLLDEPTNHLDHEMIEWLESELSKSKKAVLMVTHDRYFLERVTEQILELEHGKLYLHKGSYSDYLENKAARQNLEAANQQKINNLYRHELERVRAGVQARSTKSKSRLQRFEELRNSRHSLAQKNLEMQISSSRLGKKTVEWRNITFGYDKKQPLIKDFSYQTKRTDRIGFIGPNGCGKSTFLNLLSGDLKPDQGEFEWGETVRVGYFRQNLEMEDLELRVIDYIRNENEQIETDNGLISAENLLEQFLFDRSQFYLPLNRLSGGERRRLYLMKILMKAPNLLILDEPTNDLDLITLEILEDYLDSFPGIVISVSHDRSFLDRVCDILFVMQDNQTFKAYPGGYSELLIQQEEEKKALRQNKREHRSADKSMNKTVNHIRFTSSDKKALLDANQKMGELQDEIDQCVSAMNDESDFEKVAQLTSKMESLEALLEETTLKWMELEEKREAAGK